MDRWLRRVRGALGLGVTWGVAWFAAGMVLMVIGLFLGFTADVPFPLAFGAFGFVAGTMFSTVLGLVEGSRRFEEMSIPRFAGWGALGGLVFCGAFVTLTYLAGSPEPLETLGLLAPVFGLAGAGSAAGTLALARRAKEGDRIEAGEDAREAELTDGEAKDLLEG